MKRLLLILTMIATPAFAQSTANEGYCTGFNPQDGGCPYPWVENDHRWFYDGVPQGREYEDEDNSQTADMGAAARQEVERIHPDDLPLPRHRP